MTRQDNGIAPPRPGSPHQSPWHSATHTMLSPAITMARRHPDEALPSNHSATHTILSPAITTARRHPNPALPSNHNGTAPPTPGSAHQSQRHGATQTRPSPAITTAQRHRDHALPSNHNGTTPQRPRFPHQSQRHSAGTAPHRPGSPQQSQRHSATKLRPGDPLDANPKGAAHRAQNGHSQTCTVMRGHNPKIQTNTVPPPDPPDKNKNPSLRIREKTKVRLFTTIAGREAGRAPAEDLDLSQEQAPAQTCRVHCT